MSDRPAAILSIAYLRTIRYAVALRIVSPRLVMRLHPGSADRTKIIRLPCFAKLSQSRPVRQLGHSPYLDGREKSSGHSAASIRTLATPLLFDGRKH